MRAFVESCRRELARRVGAARADGTRALTADVLLALGREAVSSATDDLGDDGMLAILAEAPALLDAPGAGSTLRGAIRSAITGRALLELEPDLEVALGHGQEPASLDAAVSRALRALDAAGWDEEPYASGARGLLPRTEAFDTPLYAALCAHACLALAARGHADEAAGLAAARDARAGVLLRNGRDANQHREPGR